MAGRAPCYLGQMKQSVSVDAQGLAQFQNAIAGNLSAPICLDCEMSDFTAELAVPIPGEALLRFADIA